MTVRLRIAAACASVAAALAFTAGAAHAGAPTPTPTAPPGVAIERLNPPSQSASISQSSIPVQVTIEGISNLGAYEVLLTYDSAQVTFLSASNGPFLGSTGRAVFCAPPVIQVLAGTMRRLLFGCGTLGAPPPFGPNGSGLLATVNLAPVSVGLAQLMLESSLSDPLGVTLPGFAYGGEIDINTGPTPTPTFTPSPTATNTPCPGGICPSPTPVQCAPTTLAVPAVVSGAPAVGVDVPVDVANVCNLGAFEFTLSYNPALLSFVSASAGGFIGSTGRSVQCLPPQILPAAVRFGCVTLGSTPPFGAAGAGTLAFVRFVPLALGSSPLDLSAVTLLRPDASTIAATATGGALDIAPCPGCPTVTPTNTATATATATNTPIVPPTSTPTPCPGACPTATHTPTPFVASATPTPAVVPATVRIDPASYSAIPGVPLPVGISIDNAVNLGGFAFRLSFDPALFSPQFFAVGPFLGSTGRSEFCAPSAAALPPGTVQYTCGSLGHTLGGPSGSGLLGTVWLMPLAPGTSALDLSQVQLTTPSAAPVPLAAVIDGSATVASCGGPCPTPTSTPPPAATPTPGGPGAAVIGLSPAAPVDLTIGDFFSIDLTVAGVSNLGAFDVILEYNQQTNVFLEFESFVAGAFLGSTGRAVICQPPIVTAYDVRVACASLGGAPGASGGGVLGTLTFEAIGPGINAQFGIEAAGLTDPLAATLPSTIGPRITVTSLPPGGVIAAAGIAAPPDGRGSATGSGPPSQTLMLTLLGAAALLMMTLRARRAARGAIAMSALTAAALGAGALLAPGGGAAQGIVISAQPPAANLFAGAPPLVIDVRADGVPASAEIASFELAFRYDPSLVTVTAEDGGLLGSTGRTVACELTEPAAFDRLFICTTAGPAPYAAADGVLARLTVAAAPDALQLLGASSGNGGPLVLNFDTPNIALRDPANAAIPLDRVDDLLITMRVLEGDLDGDCSVGLSDRQRAISGYGSRVGDAAYAAAYDVEPPAGDGDIDVHDVQFVIGRSGSTCGDPVPVQAPVGPPPLPTATPDPNADTDVDGIIDFADNCPDTPNAAQDDGDGDGLGTACEAAFGSNDSDPDSDGDGCADGREARPITFSPEMGGDRDPADAWDFFDVTGDRQVDLGDAIDVLMYFGDDGASAEADLRDRAAPDALKPWRTAPDGDGIDLGDAIVSLASFGHDCSGTP